MFTQEFSLPLLEWFDIFGRKDLPWQHPKSAYRVWISEIMLQQTQVKTVIPYFLRFMERFPDLHALSVASEDEVFSHWSGLGYYQRARNLQKTAQIIMCEYQGEFPSDSLTLATLPGIGPSTAAAISSIVFNQPAAILDGNVSRVLSRYFLIEGHDARVKRQLWQLADSCMHKTRCADYTQAIMDLGATCCTRKQPDCKHCPLHNTCLAKKQGVMEHYPSKKLKKIRPIKAQQFLLLHIEDNIYLEKRAETGIWASLWCLPSIDPSQCPLTHVRETYGLSCETSKPLLTMHHNFTHFQLRITALSIEIKAKDTVTNEGRWFKGSEMNTLGLAKPVSRIIASFYQTIC